MPYCLDSFLKTVNLTAPELPLSICEGSQPLVVQIRIKGQEFMDSSQLSRISQQLFQLLFQFRDTYLLIEDGFGQDCHGVLHVDQLWMHRLSAPLLAENHNYGKLSQAIPS